MGTPLGVRDRSVKALGPLGGLVRRRYSQEDARRFLALGIVRLAGRSHAEPDRITCIQWIRSEEICQHAQRRFKPGTRYSFRDRVLGRAVWDHAPLPWRAIHTRNRKQADLELRAMLNNGLTLSLVVTPELKPVEQAVPAKVVSISTGRLPVQSTPRRTGVVVAMPATAPIYEMPKAA